MRDSQIRFIRQLGYSSTQFPASLYTALMFQPRVVGIVVVSGVLLQNAWIFLALSAALWWSASFASFNVFDAAYNLLVAYPRGTPPLNVAPAPRRFAQGFAGTVALVIGIALLTQLAIVAWLFQALFVVASAAVVFKNTCAGADVYHLLQHLLRRRKRDVPPTIAAL